MYERFFGCTEKPFAISPDTRFLYLSEWHREALAHLLYGVEFGNFALLTGEVGAGKTLLCRCLIEQAPENCDIALTINPKLNPCELLCAVCDEFGVAYSSDEINIKALTDRLNEHLLKRHAQGRNCVLIVDEAQNLSPEALEQLRLLTNLETPSRKLLQIILVGQSELIEMLKRPELRQLAQRIDTRFHLGKLSAKDLAPYVTHRLAVAGAPANLFPPAVMRKLHRLSRGIPRLINTICERALIGAYAQGSPVVTKRILVRAAREVAGRKWSRFTLFRPLKQLGQATAIASLCAALVATLVYGLAPKDDSPGDPFASHIQEAAQLPDNGQGLAMRALLSSWGVTIEGVDSAEQACRRAIAFGLQCLTLNGSLGSALRLKRPLVLDNLLDANERPASLALLAVRESDDGERVALIDVRGTRHIAPLHAIERSWVGSYTVLWRPPPGYERAIGKNEWSGTAEELLPPWVTKARRSAGVEAEDAPLAWVQDFQRSQGLRADGILGPLTLMRINQLQGDETASLTWPE